MSETHLDVTPRIETVQLVQKLQQGPLNLTFSTTRRIVTLGTNSIDFVDEDNRRGVFVGNTEKLADEFGAVAEVFLDQFGSDDAEESGGGLVGDGFGEEGFACGRDRKCKARPSRQVVRNSFKPTSARRSVKNDTLRRLDSHFLVKLRVRKWQFDRLLDLLNLLVETADVRVRFGRRLFQLHHADHRIRVIPQHAHNRVRLESDEEKEDERVRECQAL